MKAEKILKLKPKRYGTHDAFETVFPKCRLKLIWLRVYNNTRDLVGHNFRFDFLEIVCQRPFKNNSSHCLY